MFLRGVPAQEDRHEGDEGGAQPGRRDHAHGRVGVHEMVVVEWFADGVEPAQYTYNIYGKYHYLTCQRRWRRDAAC